MVGSMFTLSVCVLMVSASYVVHAAVHVSWQSCALHLLLLVSLRLL
jgi:hypothetical protein